MLLLKQACADNDIFFLALHQLFCVWTNNNHEAHLHFKQPGVVVNNGFIAVERVLVQNAMCAPRHLTWLAAFPAPLHSLDETGPYIHVLSCVGDFLEQAALRQARLMQAAKLRGYPHLMDELLCILRCRSTTMQHVLYTSSQRILGVEDSEISHKMDELFRADQASVLARGYYH
jgi:hypothetical protein